MTTHGLSNPYSDIFSQEDLQFLSDDSQNFAAQNAYSLTGPIIDYVLGFDESFYERIENKLSLAYKENPTHEVLHVKKFSPFTKVCLFYLDPEITEKYVLAYIHGDIPHAEYLQCIPYMLRSGQDTLAAQLVASDRITGDEAATFYESACEFKLLETAKALLSKLPVKVDPLHLACKYNFLELMDVLDFIPKGFDKDFHAWVDAKLCKALKDNPPLFEFLNKTSFSCFTTVAAFYIQPKITQKYIEACQRKIITVKEVLQCIYDMIHPNQLGLYDLRFDEFAADLITALPFPKDDISLLYEAACCHRRFLTAKALLPKITQNLHPLHLACKFAFLELIQDDALWKQAIHYGVYKTTPLHWIAVSKYEGNHSSCSNFIDKKKAIIKILIEKGINPAERDIAGATFYHYVLLNNDPELSSWLVATYPESASARTQLSYATADTFAILATADTFAILSQMHLLMTALPATPLTQKLQPLVLNSNPKAVASQAPSKDEQLDWMKNASVEFVASIIKHWKTASIQEKLRSRLMASRGVREFDTVTEDILLPFTNFQRFHEHSNNSSIARELHNKILLRAHICKIGNVNLKKITPASELEPIDFLKDPPLLAFREILFSYTLQELELFASNIEALFSEEKESDRVAPAYFLHVQDGQVMLYPLLVQQEMPSKSLLAVGRDASGMAVKKLEEILSRTFPTNKTICLTSSDCDKLLDKYKEGKKDFYLFTTHPLSHYTQAKTARQAAISVTTGQKPALPFLRLNDPIPGITSSQSNKRTISSIQTEKEPEEEELDAPANKKAKKINGGAFAVIQPQQEGSQTAALPQAPLNIQPLATFSPTIDSLDALLESFSERAQKKLQKFADLAKSQETALIEKTKELVSALSKPSHLPPIDYNAGLLKSYQQEGISWMLDLHKKGLGGVLASEPGLGKTRQAIAFLLHLQKLEPTDKPICVIVPNGIVLQWGEEIQKYLFEEQVALLQSSFERAQRGSLAVSLATLYSEQVALRDDLKAQKEQISKRTFAKPTKKKKALNEIDRKISILEARVKRSKELILQAIESTKRRGSSIFLFPALAKYITLEEAEKRKLEASFTAFLKKEEAALHETCTYRESRQLVVLFSQENQKQALRAIQEPGFATSRKILLCSESTLFASSEFASCLKKIPFACVVVDEAHSYRWKLAQEGRKPKASAARTMQDLLFSLKKAHNTSSFLLTGTPFVNSYDETLSLIQLANTHIDLSLFAAELLKAGSLLSRSLASSEANNDELLINPTNYFQALEYAKAIHNKLICVHQKSDQNIRAAWTLQDGTVCIPQKNFSQLLCVLTDEQKGFFEQQNTSNPIIFNPIAEKILFHPDLLQSEDFGEKGFQEIVQGSGILKRLFIEGQELELAIQQKKPILFFIRQRVVGNTLKKLLKMKYPSLGVSFYHGSKKQLKRDALVQRFEEPSDPLKILIISQEAGGVGLNLPSAKVVFDLAPWWNEAVTTQAESRALRVGTSGTVDIYAFSCQTPFEEAMQHIVQRKIFWKEYLFGKPKEAFSCFLQAFAFEVAREEDTSKKLLQTLMAYDAKKLSWQLNLEALFTNSQ